MLGQDKNNPAVPPGLTRMRPTHPYHHTVALFTECRSVAHRAGTPPSDCPPKSIHTIQSVPRSQHRAALCDILKTGYLLFINGFNSLMKLFWILLLHCDKVKRDFYIFLYARRTRQRRHQMSFQRRRASIIEQSIPCRKKLDLDPHPHTGRQSLQRFQRGIGIAALQFADVSLSNASTLGKLLLRKSGGSPGIDHRLHDGELRLQRIPLLLKRRIFQLLILIIVKLRHLKYPFCSGTL